MTGSNPREGQGIEIPTPQLRDVYKRWKGLEPTGFEWIDQMREYYVGLLRKELEKREALPSNNPGQRTEEGRIPVAVIGIGLGLGVAAALAYYVVGRAAVPEIPEPSALLIEYQLTLDMAYHYVETGRDYDWVMVPGWGLQYAYTCVHGGMTDPETMQVTAKSVKDLMIEEAINIGMLASAEECYFVRAIMYFTDGTTIVPYWWPCPYCPESFRSPEARDTHINEAHWEILNTKAVITGGGAIPDPTYGPVFSAGAYVTWRNDSPFAITGRLSLCMTDAHGSCMVDLGYQDALVGSGQGVRLDFLSEFAGEVGFKARLTLAGEPLPGMLLDEMRFGAGEEPEL